TTGLIVSTLAPQLPDLLLGKGSPTEQNLQSLVSGGVDLGQSLAGYLKNLEGTAAGLAKYADFYESALKTTGDPEAAFKELTTELKKDFGADISAAKQFALDFKKLRNDLVIAQAAPNSE